MERKETKFEAYLKLPFSVAIQDRNRVLVVFLLKTEADAFEKILPLVLNDGAVLHFTLQVIHDLSLFTFNNNYFHNVILYTYSLRLSLETSYCITSLQFMVPVIRLLINWLQYS